MRIKVDLMVKMAVLCALSLVLLLLIRFPIIPSAAFLEYEPADVPILIGGFLFGPLAGFIITMVASLIQAVTVSASGGWVGFVMHVIATGTLVMVSSFIYKRFHTLRGGIIALAVGSLSMTLIMIPSNLFFTVRFYGVPYDTVKAMLFTAIIPFNLIKSVINSIIVILVYKSAGKVLRKQVKQPSRQGR